MNTDQLDDLKQFITATVSQAEAQLEERLGGRIDSVETGLVKLETKMDDGFARLETKMDDGFAGIGEAIEQIHARVDTNEDDIAKHDKRLTKLEQHTV